MGDLSRNLSRREFECPCGCGFDTVDFMLVVALQDTVDYFQELYNHKQIRIRINSGARCKQHNTAVGGGDKSQHLYAKAADITLYDRASGEPIPPSEVAEYLDWAYPYVFGIGKYTYHTHLDVRKDKARWDKT